jgi:hypothetical protein
MNKKQSVIIENEYQYRRKAMAKMMAISEIRQ